MSEYTSAAAALAASQSSATAWPPAVAAELSQLVLSEPLLAEDGTPLTPAEQPWPTSTVRGELGEEMIDYVSGSHLPLGPMSWLNPGKTLSQAMQWWTDCLPVPQALQESP